MSDASSTAWSIRQSKTLYGIDRWGNGYYDINQHGHVCVRPNPNQDASVELVKLIQEAESLGLHLPILVRFNGIIRDSLAKIQQSFDDAIEAYGYQNRYRCVFPIKVNQQCEVVRQVGRHGQVFGAGLEAGSKAELIAVIATGSDETPIICNGFKDTEYVRLAMTAKQMGRTVIPVVEKANELKLIVQVAEELGVKPTLGIRVKLATQGSGRWKASGGCRSKFGLSISELLQAYEWLAEQGLQDCFELLHFHIGSQIGNIRDLKLAITEGARVYVELVRRGAGLRRLDVGGGLGVDYDGSNSDTPSSRNYTLQEYANDVVFHVQSICDQAGVPHPELISESGRAAVASHSVLVVSTLGVASSTTPLPENGADPDWIDRDVIAHSEPPLQDLWHTYLELSANNIRESLHDAQASFDLALNLFSGGYLPLEQRAMAEQLYAAICHRVSRHAQQQGDVPKELKKLERMFADIYFANFSIFQSLPDAWAIQQLFPVMPIERLTEQPTNAAVIGDITCDSDGMLERFRCDSESRDTLLLHPLRDNEHYRLGLFLVGAYQEILGDLHNLFGDTHAVHVDWDDESQSFRVASTVYGDTLGEVLGYLQYDENALADQLQALVEAARARDQLTGTQARAAFDLFHKAMLRYTYLLPPTGVADA